MTPPKELNQASSILTFASIAVVVGALYLGKGLLVPLTLAVLLSFMLSPMCDWLERRRLGRIPSVLVTAILGFTLLVGLTWTAAVQITSLAPKIPEYQTNIEAKLSSVNAYAVAPLLTVALFVVLELLNNNLLEPWLYGKNTGVSAVAVLVAAIFWMWLWGPVGLLLATPLTVCLLVVGKHVPELSFLGILLGSDPVFELSERVYQRLLAGDSDEAAELFGDYLEHQSLSEAYDAVLIPALSLAETHWRLGELTDVKHEFIMDSLKDMIQDQGERQRELLTKGKAATAEPLEEVVGSAHEIGSAGRSVLCVPARSEADEIAAQMLAQVLTTTGYQVQTISLKILTDDLSELVDQCEAADLVCISATPPAAVMHARYLSKRLRDRLPEVDMLVGLWDSPTDLSKAGTRIGCDAIVVATLKSAQEQIDALILAQCAQPDPQIHQERNLLVKASV